MPKPDEYPPGDYAEIWKKIDSLEKQGLFKSALEQTEALHLRAKADGKGAQVIKTLLFRGKYTTMLEEDGFVKAVQQFEAEVLVASEPEKSILQNMLGQLYRTYLDNQRWRIQERTPIPDGEGGDIMTWSAEQLEKRAVLPPGIGAAGANFAGYPDRLRQLHFKARPIGFRGQRAGSAHAF
ncbi:MAG: hypothetical protein H6569_02495 [Lewinellaceae bacterium]|nr:hypothetical protein [Lewinellaceae bacterium]